MKLAEAEMVMEYCADIRRKRRAIERHRAELNDEISGIRGMNMDGMPRGSQPGDSTAAMACRMEALGIAEELKSLDKEEASLRADEALILEKLRSIHSVHSEILLKRAPALFSVYLIASIGETVPAILAGFRALI